MPKPCAADEERIRAARSRAARHVVISGRGSVDGIEVSAEIGLDWPVMRSWQDLSGDSQQEALVPADERCIGSGRIGRTGARIGQRRGWRRGSGAGIGQRPNGWRGGKVRIGVRHLDRLG